MSDASEDDFIVALEHLFGMDGYARWWKLLETVAKASKKDRFSARLPLVKWRSNLKAKQKQLTSFLDFLQKEERIICTQTENILQIEIPKLLNFKDEYTRKSGHSQDDVPSESESTQISGNRNVEGSNTVANIHSVSREESKAENVKPSTPNPKYLDDSPPMIMARRFYDHVLVVDPRHPAPNWQSWAKSFDGLLRIDGRSTEEVRSVVAFLATDNFWRSNVLSPKKLREKFSTLVAKLNNPQQPLESSPRREHVGRRQHDFSEYD